MVTTTCPKCKALFRLADEMAGKRVKCKKCEHVFVVAGGDKGAPDDSAAVKSVPKAPAAPPKKDTDDSATDDNGEVPRRRKKPVSRNEDELDDDDNDDSSSRRSKRRRRDDEDADDEELDDRPRRGRRSKRRSEADGSNMTTVLAILIGGGLVFFVVCAGGFGFFYFAAEKNIPNVGRQKDKKFVKKGGVRQPNQKPVPIDVAFAADGTFRHDSQIAANDPFNVEGTRHKLYRVRLEAGRTYEIDMMSNRIDSVLILLDENDEELDSDDDGGDDLNARLVFVPRRTAVYFIEATHFPDDERPPLGPYTLSIRRR